jgi:hypothetical protein
LGQFFAAQIAGDNLPLRINQDGGGNGFNAIFERQLVLPALAVKILGPCQNGA